MTLPTRERFPPQAESTPIGANFFFVALDYRTTNCTFILGFKGACPQVIFGPQCLVAECNCLTATRRRLNLLVLHVKSFVRDFRLLASEQHVEYGIKNDGN